MTLSVLVWAGGCSQMPTRGLAPPSPAPVKQDATEHYLAFLAENQALLDQLYTDRYSRCRFEVDGEAGPVLVQHLIEPEKVYPLAQRIVGPGAAEAQALDSIRHYLRTTITYRPMPDAWPSVSTTLSRKQADCKGLSLLMLSLLLAAGQEAYAAVNNGHMWVVAKVNGCWRNVETDPDPRRTAVYEKVPGFYDRPMFVIHADRTLKRKRR